MAYTKDDMNHSQFYRYETYGRAAQKPKEGQKSAKGGKTMYDIIGEATRQEGYTEHLEHPEEPVLLYGIPYSEALKLAEKWCEESKEIRHDKKKVKKINEQTGEEEEVIETVERKTALKKTAQCCIAGIVSAPPDMTEDDWNKFKNDSIEYLKQKYGDRLKTVVEHLDENYQTENFKDVLHHHIHYFVVPEIGEKIEDIHPGLKAKYEADYLRGNREASAKATKEEKKLSRKTGDKAYRDAMRKEQDDFYDAVSYNYNLNRKGKKRCNRLTRPEFLIYNEERNAEARRKNAFEAEKKIVAQEKKDAKEILEREASVKTKEAEVKQRETDADRREKEQAEWIEKQKTAHEYLKAHDIDSNYFVLDTEIPELLEPEDAIFSSEKRSDYAIRNLKNFKKIIDQKVDHFKRKFNSLVNCVKTLLEENKILRKENKTLKEDLNKTVSAKVTAAENKLRFDLTKTHLEEKAKLQEKADQWDNFLKGTKTNFNFPDGLKFTCLTGVNSIRKMSDAIQSYKNLTPYGLRNLADRMEELKMTGNDVYEKVISKGSSIGEWLDKPISKGRGRGGGFSYSDD